MSGYTGTKSSNYVRGTRGYFRRSGFYGRYPSNGGSSVGPLEYKFLDNPVSALVINTAGQVDNVINTLAQGTSESERVGRKVMIHSFHWRFRLNLLNTLDADDTGICVRLMVVIDKQTNGSAYALSELLAVPGTFDPAHAFRNLQFQNRFVVLMDRMYCLNAQTTVGTQSGAVVVYDEFNKAMSLPVEYGGTTGSIAEQRSNSLSVVFMKTATGNAEIEYNTRVRFTD
jgi:hypothetical protein